MSTIIFDHERGQYWRGNKFGYTDKLEDAGRFDYQEALEIMEDANIFDMNTTIFNETDIKEIAKSQKLLNQNSIRPKRDLSEILAELSTQNQYDKTNPYGKIIDKLASEGYYVDKDISVDCSLYNEETKTFNLSIKNSNLSARVVIHRMSSGNYETTAYPVNPNFKNNDGKKRKRVLKNSGISA